jgi:hypothetical protein
MLKKIFATAALLSSVLCSYSQDSSIAKTSSTTLSGYIDLYFRYNLNNPKKQSESFNNYTSFTNSHNSFELNMVSLKLEHSINKVGMVADIGFGNRAEEFSYNDDNTRFIVKQAYLSYTPWENVKFTAGSWATHIGYELVDPVNRNYSMSYLFSKGPFFHTGLKAEATRGKSSYMIGIANPSDLKSANFSTKFLVAQYGFTGSNDFKAYLNYQGGKFNDTRLNQFDLVVTTPLSEQFSVGLNASVLTMAPKINDKYGKGDSWWGSAVYINADPVSWLGLTLRGEYFSDNKQLTDVFGIASRGGEVFGTTLSANFKIDNLTIIPEIRFDNASEEIFTRHPGVPVKHSATALVAAVYKF